MAFTEDQRRDHERTLERGPLTVHVDAGAAECRIGLIGELDLSNVDLLDHQLTEAERAGGGRSCST